MIRRSRTILSKLENMEALKREDTGKGTKYKVIKMKNDIEL